MTLKKWLVVAQSHGKGHGIPIFSSCGDSRRWRFTGTASIPWTALGSRGEFGEGVVRKPIGFGFGPDLSIRHPKGGVVGTRQDPVV